MICEVNGTELQDNIIKDQFPVPICKDVSNKDTQPHLLVCNKLVDEDILAQEVPDYQHLLSDNLEKQVKIIKILQTKFKKRTRILYCEKGMKSTNCCWSE